MEQKSKTTMTKRASPSSLYYVPVHCPITDCGRVLGATAVLSHFLNDHANDYGVDFREIYANKRAVLFFKPAALEMGQVYCLGVLAYGGCADDPETLPAARGLGVHNNFLMQSQESLKKHLTILIMGSRTTWASMVSDKNVEKKLNAEDNGENQLVVLWLTCVQTAWPIYATMTVFNRTETTSFSSLIQLRALSDSQDPNDFFSDYTHSLQLSKWNLDLLSADASERVGVEIVIDEYE